MKDREAVKAAIISIVAKCAGKRPETLTEDTRLLQDLGMDGDDAYQTIWDIDRRVGMDWSEFPFLSHFNDEPDLACFFGRPRMDLKPLTIGDLVRGAMTGRLT